MTVGRSSVGMLVKETKAHRGMRDQSKLVSSRNDNTNDAFTLRVALSANIGAILSALLKVSFR